MSTGPARNASPANTQAQHPCHVLPVFFPQCSWGLGDTLIVWLPWASLCRTITPPGFRDAAQGLGSEPRAHFQALCRIPDPSAPQEAMLPPRDVAQKLQSTSPYILPTSIYIPPTSCHTPVNPPASLPTFPLHPTHTPISCLHPIYISSTPHQHPPTPRLHPLHPAYIPLHPAYILPTSFPSPPLWGGTASSHSILRRLSADQ